MAASIIVVGTARVLVCVGRRGFSGHQSIEHMFDARRSPLVSWAFKSELIETLKCSTRQSLRGGQGQGSFPCFLSLVAMMLGGIQGFWGSLFTRLRS